MATNKRKVCVANTANWDGTTAQEASTADLESALKLMVAYRAVRLKTLGLELELSPLAFAAPSAPQQPDTALSPETRCACGHDLDVEHNEAGCLRGCPVQVCAPEATAP